MTTTLTSPADGSSATSAASTTSSSMVTIVDDDNVWGEILLNLDFDSVQRLMGLLRSQNEDRSDGAHHHGDHRNEDRLVSLLPLSSFRRVWTTLFHRHYFAPIDDTVTSSTGSIAIATNAAGAARGGDDDLYWRLTLERRRLLSNLFQDEKQLKQKSKKEQKNNKKLSTGASSQKTRARTRCFNLPNRYFHFKPIVPAELLLEQEQEGMEMTMAAAAAATGAASAKPKTQTEPGNNNDNDPDEQDQLSSSPSSVSWINGYLPNQQQQQHEHQQQRNHNHRHNHNHQLQQPPPVVFECDSFVLTSPGVSGELVFLDPFDGRLQVLRDIKTHCVASDEAMMEHAMVQATKAILTGASGSASGGASGGDAKNSKINAVKTKTKSIPIQKHTIDDSSSLWSRSSAGHCNNNNSNDDDDDDIDAEIAGAAIDESIYRNHTQSTRLHHADTQELLSDNEYFTFDITPYFVDRGGGGGGGNDNGGLRAAFGEDEFDLCYVGVDARPIMEFDEYNQNHKSRTSSPSSSFSSSRITGFMAAVGRTVTNINHDDMVCSELTVWKRKNISILDNEDIKKHNNGEGRRDDDEDHNNNNPSYYKTKFVCRFRSNLELVDFDPRTDRAFVLKSGGSGLENSRAHNMNHRSTTTRISTTTTVSRRRNNLVINIYPMIECDDDDESNDDIDGGHNDCLDSVPTTKYFPTPLASVCCDGQPRCFAVDGTGNTLVVGTDAPAIEVWDVQCNKKPRRMEVLDVRKTLRKSINDFLGIVHTTCHGRRNTLTSSRKSASHTASAADQNASSRAERNVDTPDVSLVALERQPNLPHICAPVDSIFVPKHLPATAAGFVTLHYSRDEGSSLILWRYIGTPGSMELTPSSIINLRLSTRRKPRVTYDGNRIIVLGEDHIGVIILVYQVSNGNESFPVETDFDAMTCEHSGGVYNLTNPPQIRFRNRIRHVALGGINRSDTLHLTSNERFIIVNTKAGDLLTGASFPFSEGLLVIDLKDERWDENSATLEWFFRLAHSFGVYKPGFSV
eukprot:CAMPEP_0113483128 /NCGR_PEP_ID=MMETSP0014_2-20120614/23275_1 /TAXON_ID=2857 /ORGANISM="Nitzschia sp." /LENGTH=1022 /DNA_ID=CAMNT_0000376667 /DNA_START=94 /DNA_END=3163 /DNA_ORIENTATION=+ /assembly_acc=CAM_ASM_000159